MLLLAEEIFLLSLLEKKDAIRIPSSVYLPYGLAGAVLIELVIEGYFRIEDRKLVPVADHAQPADELQKSVLEKIHKVGKIRKFENWVYVLGTKGSRLSRGIVHSLIEKGLLREEGKSYQWGAANQTQYSMEAYPTKYKIKNQLREAIIGNGQANERITLMLSLLESCELLEHIFTKDEIIVARKKIRLIKKDEHLSTQFIELLETLTNAVEYAAAAAVSV